MDVKSKMKNTPVKLFEHYPFADARVELYKGFDAGKGIDYVLRDKGRYRKFNVYSMHAGVAIQGYHTYWGRFVLVRATFVDRTFDTIYAHLDDIADRQIPFMQIGTSPSSPHREARDIPAAYLLGRSGMTGRTKCVVRLHIELQVLEKQWGNSLFKSVRLDPYGLGVSADLERYPQPGKPLTGLPHVWTSDEPLFADGSIQQLESLLPHD